MDNGASSYRRFRDNGDDSGLDEIIMDYSTRSLPQHRQTESTQSSI